MYDCIADLLSSDMAQMSISRMLTSCSFSHFAPSCLKFIRRILLLVHFQCLILYKLLLRDVLPCTTSMSICLVFLCRFCLSPSIKFLLIFFTITFMVPIVHFYFYLFTEDVVRGWYYLKWDDSVLTNSSVNGFHFTLFLFFISFAKKNIF